MTCENKNIKEEKKRNYANKSALYLFPLPLCFCTTRVYFLFNSPSPLSQLHQMNRDKSKSSEKIAANEENEARELISNVSLEEHAELSTDNTGDEGDKDLGLN